MDEQFLWIATGLFPKVTQLVMVRAWFESQNLGLQLPGSYLVSQSVKNLPAMEETWVQSLGQQDPLEEEMATHFSIVA